ncbi:methyltransferase [Mycobacterium sherrisii]|uniref:methyltransferase n=1 Tax=Mycobacterium sherrisii TaxID=243061 RepID=UPI0039758911
MDRAPHIATLVGIGIFGRRRDGRYQLTSLGDTLRTDAPVSMAGMTRWVGSPQHREHWSNLTDAIRTGHAVIPELRGKSAFEYLAEEPELARIFNAAMTNLSEMSTAPLTAAYDFSAFGTIVDVGGGHGRLLSAILTTAPNSRGILFDLPAVVAGARSCCASTVSPTAPGPRQARSSISCRPAATRTYSRTSFTTGPTRMPSAS